MQSFRIEIDEEIMDLLLANSEPFEDTPQNILKKLLGLKKKGLQYLKFDIPVNKIKVKSKALLEILGVIYFMKTFGCTRIQATRAVARKRKILYESVADKYTRRMRLNLPEMDILLTQPGLIDLKALLKKRFPRYSGDINYFFLRLFESQP